MSSLPPKIFGATAKPLRIGSWRDQLLILPNHEMQSLNKSFPDNFRRQWRTDFRGIGYCPTSYSYEMYFHAFLAGISS